MKLSLAFASTVGLILSQGQGVAGISPYVSSMSGVVLEGDGCANLDCGDACYELSDAAKKQLNQISKGNAAGDTTKVPSGQFWKLGVCNKGGQCVTDVAAASNSCDDPANDATIYLVTGGGSILTDLAARAVTAFGNNLLCAQLTAEEIVEAARVALQALLISRQQPVFGSYNDPCAGFLSGYCGGFIQT